MTVTLASGSIKRKDVGVGGYAVGIGYDPGDGVVRMVGYTLAPGVEYNEGDNLQDEQHIVQIASPNSSDRFSRYPVISQGDWTHGGRQVLLTDLQAFYDSQDMDTTNVGVLQPTPQFTVIKNNTSGGGYDEEQYASVANGDIWIVGFYDIAGGKNAILNGNPILISDDGVTNSQILDFCVTPAGIFAGTKTNGILLIDLITPQNSVEWSEDNLWDILTYNKMTYFSHALWYIKSDGSIQSLTAPLTPGTSYAVPGMEFAWQILCSTANGLFMATGNVIDANGGVGVLYTADGANPPVIVGQVNARPVACLTLNGVTYILVEPSDDNNTHSYQLFSLSGSSLTLIDDLRFDNPAFQPLPDSLPPVDIFGPSLKTEGRYLYIGWPGLPGLRYDPVVNAFSFCGGPAFVGNSQRHRTLLPTNHGLIDILEAVGTPYLIYIRLYDAASTVGYLDMSYADFGEPGLNKLWLGLDVDFTQAQPDPECLTVLFRVDDEVSFTPASSIRQGVGTGLRVYLPVRTIGKRIQFRVGYDASHFTMGVPWQVRGISIRGQLARVLQFTVACFRDAKTHNGIADPQGLAGFQLYANLLNARDIAGGDVYMFIGDPTDPYGDSSYTTTIRGQIQQINKKVAAGVNPAGYSPPGSNGFDMDQTVALVITEEISAVSLGE